MAEIMNFFEESIDYQKLAAEKIEKETEEFDGDKYGKVVYKYVANTIKELCEKDKRFAAVVCKTKRSLSDCCAEIMKKCGTYISDLEVYKKAAQFYFPNCRLSCVMEIELTGDEPDEKYLNKEAPKKAAAPATPAAKKPEKPKPKEKPKSEKAESIQISLF